MPPRLRLLVETDDAHRLAVAAKLGLGDAPAQRPPKRVAAAPLPCLHRSAAPIAKEPCRPCDAGRRILVDVYACSSPKVKPRRCTIAEGREVENAKPCLACRHREAPPMDAVYFFRPSGAADEELRYSLRSLVRHAPWLRTIYVLGDRPRWYQDSERVVHVSWETVAASYGWKTPLRNAFLMLVAATAIPGIAEEFLSLSDDFVVLRPLSREAASIDRDQGELRSTKPDRPHLYQDAVWRTRQTLRKLGYPTRNFDCHIPMRFTRERILAAYEDFRPYLSERRHQGLTNKIAVLNHAMQREGFAPTPRGSVRVGWWTDAAKQRRGERIRPTAEEVRTKCESGALFLNFDDGTYGPEIEGYLRERFPVPGSWERPAGADRRDEGSPGARPPKASAPAGTAALHVHVVKHSGWVIGRIADAICCERTTVSRAPDPSADVNLYVHYRAMREPVPGTLNVAWFTHLEESGSKRREFFDVAAKADWCLAMSRGTAKHLPPEKTSVWYGAPDREFVKPVLRLGVAVKPGPRKGLAKLDALRSIEGVEIVETKGELPIEKLPEFFRSIDCLVVTSDLEGGPYAVLEAIAAGKPVIAPDVGFCWDFRSVVRYDGTAEDLAAVVRGMRFPPDPWAAASRELEGILREALERCRAKRRRAA